MTGGDSFQSEMRVRTERVEAAIERLLPQDSTYPSVIHTSMRYSALGGGKRLRGVLVLEAAGLQGSGAVEETASGGEGGEESAHLLPAVVRRVGPAAAVAAAVELLHAYSLVHDDLPCMDDDDMRRGKPTNHRMFGEGIAVLAGDSLLTRAFEVVARLPWAGVTAEATAEIVGELATAAGTGGLIGGQVADLEAEGALANQAAEDPSDLLHYIHAHKTGALFRAALRMGGIVGGADAEGLERLGAYAHHFGLAFQITDDLLDVEGDTETLGKEVGSDERKGKLTFPALYGLEESKRMAAEEIERAKASVSSYPNSGFLTMLAEYVLHRRS